ncbi:MAG: hypothetical protein AAFQ68_21260 [Bacteroidota bacterium]
MTANRRFSVHQPLRFWLSFFLLLAMTMSAQAQRVGDYLGDERVLYATTKQVNQFFRRFNGEESPLGERYYPKDSLYRHPPLRREYLEMLFDDGNQDLDGYKRNRFVREVLNGRDPIYLDFHGGEFFAEVKTSFSYKGQKQNLTLFLKLEEDTIGSKWVFTNVYFEPFARTFREAGESDPPDFLHPLSHELDFMNLIKVFREANNPEKFTEQGFQPDYLTLFLYEYKKGNLKFHTVNQVKFHFFQIEGWYFELAEVDRKEGNRGWLITQMTELAEGNKEILLNYIYRQ